MTFCNCFNSFNINRFCSGFGGFFNNCSFTPFGNFSFMQNPWFTNFNFSMPIFNNFNIFGSFTSFTTPFSNFGCWNSISSTSIWNAYPTATPQFNMNTYNFISTPSWGTDTFTLSGTTSVKSKGTKKTTSTLPAGIPSNYNAELGRKLSRIALSNAGHYYNQNTKQIVNRSKDPDEFTGNCAAYVKMAIRDAGAGSYVTGHGYQMTEILKNNSNFKQISPNSVNLKDLPAGCVLVYARGAEGYSPEYGHTEIITEDGRGVSDGITDNLYKKPTAIFVPVTA